MPTMHYCRYQVLYQTLKEIRDDLMDPDEELSEEEKQAKYKCIGLMELGH